MKVRYNEARYGRDLPCGDIVCDNTWALIKDAIDTWVASQHAAGRTDDQIKADLASYRPVGPQRLRRRRQLQRARRLHRPLPDRARRRRPGRRRPAAGRGRDLVAPLEGVPEQRPTGPRSTRTAAPRSARTGLWVADYTIQPENGGLSVFAHEYGHDLGLPDHYDTAGGDNAVNWWTLMAQSRVSAAERPGHRHQARRPRRVGQAPARLARLRGRARRARTARSTSARTSTTAPRPRASSCRSARPEGHDDLRRARRRDQAVVVRDGRRPGRLDDAVGHAARRAAGTARLPGALEHRGLRHRRRATTRTSRSNDGTGWKALPGSITKAAEGNGIDGVQADLEGRRRSTCPRYAGKTVQLRLRYRTDGAAQGNPDASFEPGIYADQITIKSGSTTVFTDGAESGANGWTLDGLHGRRRVRRSSSSTTTTWRRTASTAAGTST